MTKQTCTVGDRVRWNAEAGHVTGRVSRVHTKDIEFMGRARRCIEDDPQFRVASDTTDHHAMHRAEALSTAD